MTPTIMCGPGQPSPEDRAAVEAFARFLRTDAQASRDPNTDRPDPGETLREYDDPWAGEFDPGIDGDAPSRYDR
jgi:hypothetical protein